MNREALEIELATLSSERRIFLTSHEDLRTGGTALLVRVAAFEAGCTFTVGVIEKGRVLAVRAQHRESSVTLVSVHNFGMSIGRANAVAAGLMTIVSGAQADPLRQVAILPGDWNFDAPGEALLSASGERGHLRVGPAALRAVLGNMFEAHQPRPTRADPGAGLMSRIDRIYISIPGWILLRMDVRAWAEEDPLWLHLRGISDHAPVFMRIAPRRRQQHSAKRIPQWIAATAEYQRRLLDLERAAKLNDLSLWDRLAMQKLLIREAAERTLRQAGADGGEAVTPDREDRSMIAAARAVAAGEKALLAHPQQQ